MGQNLLKEQSSGIKNAFMTLRLCNACFLFLLMNMLALFRVKYLNHLKSYAKMDWSRTLA